MSLDISQGTDGSQLSPDISQGTDGSQISPYIPQGIDRSQMSPNISQGTDGSQISLDISQGTDGSQMSPNIPQGTDGDVPDDSSALKLSRWTGDVPWDHWGTPKGMTGDVLRDSPLSTIPDAFSPYWRPSKINKE
ncbi:hypothetical protein AAHA92_06140 [Salvia divinorum]|uniref:Uncharacterized protein n=1 Tax=Salvia divinorum TaxID=28513 RepID=A0ABD1I8A7_SALDI